MIQVHYHVPLPLQDPDTIFSNNHLQTFSGLKYSKQWFRRDKRYFTDYKGFNEDTIDKEYTK